MQGYVDGRWLIITDSDDHTDKSRLKSVTIFTLPGGELVELDEISQKISEELDAIYKGTTAIDIGGHYVKDTRHDYSIGASAVTQEVVLALVTAATGGAVTVLVQKLSEWCMQKINNEEGYYAPLGETVDDVMQTVQGHFVPQGPLEVLEASKSKAGSRVVLKDSTGNQYEAEAVRGNPNSLRIVKISTKQDVDNK
jgi:hypothetical protein